MKTLNATEALAAAKKEIDAIANLPKGTKRTLGNTLAPFDRAALIISEVRSRAHLLAAVHPNKAVQKTAEKTGQKLSQFSTELYLRKDIYEAIQRVSPAGLDEDAKRFREKELRDFILSGVDKPEKSRKEIRKLAGEMIKLGQAFDRNIKESVLYLKIPEQKLAGFPEDYRKAHKPDGKGRVTISTEYPDYFPFMQYASDGEERKKLHFLFQKRAWPKNENIFRQLLEARKREANLLGFKNWADYATADKMIGSAKAVHAFIDQVAASTMALAKKDMKVLLERKKKDDPAARTIEPWDYSYYENLVTKEQIGLDSRETRNYFSFKEVKQGVLKTAADLFDLSYKKISVPVWHPEVEVFDMYRNKKLVGRFYLDLHSRKGKYGHAACFDIRLGIRGKQLPEAALVCNFSKELMDHGEVTTFLHEFGHLVHLILGGDQRWARFSGFATEWDFVEAPSQMLEAWALDFETLKTFAKHNKTGKPIPRALVEKIREAEHFGKATWLQRQIFYAGLSLRYHEEPSPKTADLFTILINVQKKYDVIRYRKGVYLYANFGHLNGYSALYYTYVWSRAIAQDILTPFEKKGMRNRSVAKQYVEKVLIPGGSKDARVLIRDFLGRDWNLKALKHWLKR